MSENASHVIIHHYIENSSSFNCVETACCIILIVVIVILLLIVVGVSVYMMIYFNRHCHSRRSNECKTAREMHGYDNAINVSSCNTATVATSTEADVVEDDNGQSIPMTTFRTQNKTDGRCHDSSDSSAGLYDVLFPEQPEGEVIYDPPTKLLTYAGQVYAPGSRPESSAGPSGSRRHRDSESLVWDYFQQPAGTPANSEVGSDTDPRLIDNICWV